MIRRCGPPRWQDSWKKKCLERCCRSPHCANIKCAACFQSIVFPCPPRTRYSCRECMDDDIDIDLCQACFEGGGRENHWHTDWWLRVEPDGTHTEILPFPPSPSDAPPQPDRLVRAVTASIEGRPCVACAKFFVNGEQVIQLRCRCTYHQDCLSADQECCIVCTSPKEPSQTPAMIHVKTEDGRTLTFRVNPGDTVSRVKELIADEDQISMQTLQLTWNRLDVLDAEPLVNFIGSPVPFELRSRPSEP